MDIKQIPRNAGYFFGPHCMVIFIVSLDNNLTSSYQFLFMILKVTISLKMWWHSRIITERLLVNHLGMSTFIFNADTRINTLWLWAVFQNIHTDLNSRITAKLNNIYSIKQIHPKSTHLKLVFHLSSSFYWFLYKTHINSDINILNSVTDKMYFNYDAHVFQDK